MEPASINRKLLEQIAMKLTILMFTDSKAEER